MKYQDIRVNMYAPDGPWHILLDGEKFLHTGASKEAYAACGGGVKTWKLPAKSPDLNPIEKFWGWLRRELRFKDLADLNAKRPVLSRAQYKARVRAICASAKARRVGSGFAKGYRNVCKEVVRKKGQRARG